MNTVPEEPDWTVYLVGLLLWVFACLLVDFVLHSAQWTGGQWAHRLPVMTFFSTILGALIALANYVQRRRRTPTKPF